MPPDVAALGEFDYEPDAEELAEILEADERWFDREARTKIRAALKTLELDEDSVDIDGAVEELRDLQQLDYEIDEDGFRQYWSTKVDAVDVVLRNRLASREAIAQVNVPSRWMVGWRPRGRRSGASRRCSSSLGSLDRPRPRRSRSRLARLGGRFRVGGRP